MANLYPTLTEWCSTDPNNGLHPIWIQLAADCCDPTSSSRRSWGGIKTIYR